MNARQMPAAALAALLALTAGGEPASSAPREPRDTESARLTADALVRWVIDSNPGLAAAGAAAEAAAYRIEPAGSLEDPMLSYDVAPLTADAGRGLHQSIAVSQEIPWPGTLAAREGAARHEARAAARDADSLRLEIVAQAKSAHAEWRYIGAALDIHHGTRSLLDDLLATVETRYAAGDARRQDVLQAELELAELENHLLRLVRERSAIQARINALLDRAPGAPLPEAAPITLEPPPPSLDALTTLARAHHPELSRLDAELAASESRVTLAEKAFFPNFEVGVGYNGMWESADQRPMVGISINVPLDRGKRRSDLDRARAETRRARFALSGRRSQLLAELATARAEAVQARQSVALYRERLVPLAAQYLDAAIADYRSGAGAFLNVITAEQRKLETELELARALSNYARRSAELERWVGGSLDAAALPRSAGAGS